MKLYEIKRKVKGKEHVRYTMNLTKREAYLFRKLGKEFVIDDVDEKSGDIFLKPKNETTTTFGISNCDPVSSFRVYLDKADYERVKVECRRRGLSLCRVVSDFLRCCLEQPGLVESPGGVKVVNVFLGKPRSKYERKLWEERLKGEEFEKG